MPEDNHSSGEDIFALDTDLGELERLPAVIFVAARGR